MSARIGETPVVVNALTQHRLMCVVHGHRPATDRCDVCHRPFCAECLVRGGAQLQCQECVAATATHAAAEREQRRPVKRARAAIGGVAGNPLVIAGLLVVVVLSGVAAAARFDRSPRSAGTAADSRTILEGAKNLQQAQQDFADFAAEQQRLDCARGVDMRGPSGGNCEQIQPTPIIRAKPQTIVQVRRVTAAGVAAGIADPGGQFAPMSLLTNDGPSTPGWRSATSALPQELTFELASVALVDHIAFRQTQASQPASWAREVELLLSAGAAGPYTSVGTWTLAQATDPQQFSFLPKQAGYARLRVLSRYGDASYTALGAVAFGIATGDPGTLLAR